MRPEGFTVSCLLLAGAAGAYADEAAGPAKAPQRRPVIDVASEQPALLEEIVVTSSRAALPGFSASTPTRVVGSDTIEREDAPNIAQVLDEIPGFKQTQSPAANGVKTGNSRYVHRGSARPGRAAHRWFSWTDSECRRRRRRRTPASSMRWI